jgi:hypothetical protein
MEQETLDAPHATFDPLAHGLWSRVLDNGRVDHGLWLRTCAEGGFVGTCRICGDYVRPSHPAEVGTRTDYEYACRSTTCGQTYLSVGGRTLTRSSRRAERPGAAAF